MVKLRITAQTSKKSPIALKALIEGNLTPVRGRKNIDAVGTFI